MRVVGIFFGNNGATGGPIAVDVDKSEPSVADVLAAARAKVNNGGVPNVSLFGFSPVSPAPNEDLSMVGVVYKNDFKSGLSGKPYAAGLYLERDGDAGDGLDLVWQYYIFDENDVFKTTQGFGVVTFSTPITVANNGFAIGDNYSVTLRLVAIRTGPTMSARMESRIKALANV
ncbi:MAG: hypothetical protein GVY24_02990 [Planctomycetes bacterium]|nr:hypothetical protein [Planctomycetota bacterium]